MECISLYGLGILVWCKSSMGHFHISDTAASSSMHIFLPGTNIYLFQSNNALPGWCFQITFLSFPSSVLALAFRASFNTTPSSTHSPLSVWMCSNDLIQWSAEKCIPWACVRAMRGLKPKAQSATVTSAGETGVWCILVSWVFMCTVLGASSHGRGCAACRFIAHS